MTTVARIVNELRAARHEAGVSQLEMANKLHVSTWQISGWETGGRAMPVRYAELYAQALGHDLQIVKGGAR